jgi:NAD(P)-dependent dehydrogenase (short-subunit alcohol dehydrogenase family)
VFPLADFTRVIEINLIGTFNVIRLAAERMVRLDPASKGGVVGIRCPSRVIWRACRSA